jgi:hypothetical protein
VRVIASLCIVVAAAALAGTARGATGRVTTFPLAAGCEASGIAPGLDGNLWISQWTATSCPAGAAGYPPVVAWPSRA